MQWNLNNFFQLGIGHDHALNGTACLQVQMCISWHALCPPVNRYCTTVDVAQTTHQKVFSSFFDEVRERYWARTFHNCLIVRGCDAKELFETITRFRIHSDWNSDRTGSVGFLRYICAHLHGDLMLTTDTFIDTQSGCVDSIIYWLVECSAAPMLPRQLMYRAYGFAAWIACPHLSPDWPQMSRAACLMSFGINFYHASLWCI